MLTGKELFDLYKSNDFVMQSTTNFLPYFKGLQLASTRGNMHAVYGFKDSITNAAVLPSNRCFYYKVNILISLFIIMIIRNSTR